MQASPSNSIPLSLLFYFSSTVWKGQNVAWLHHDKPSIYAKRKKWIKNKKGQARFSSFNAYAVHGQSLGRIALQHEPQNRSENSMERYLKISAICNNMALLDETRDYHIKWSKPSREIQMPWDITGMWNLKKIQMNLFTKQKQKTNLWPSKGKEYEEYIRRMGLTYIHILSIHILHIK